MPQLPTYDALAIRSATREDINATRDRLEQSPIVANSHLVDCDIRSETRMQAALEAFDLIAPEGTLHWTLADNTMVEFTEQQLQDTLHAMRYARAIRGAKLHAIARGFKTLLDDGTFLSLRDICDDNWL